MSIIQTMFSSFDVRRADERPDSNKTFDVRTVDLTIGYLGKIRPLSPRPLHGLMLRRGGRKILHIFSTASLDYGIHNFLTQMH